MVTKNGHMKSSIKTAGSRILIHCDDGRVCDEGACVSGEQWGG